eukprot:2749309-Rhodomonas_salina.1
MELFGTEHAQNFLDLDLLHEASLQQSKPLMDQRMRLLHRTLSDPQAQAVQAAWRLRNASDPAGASPRLVCTTSYGRSAVLTVCGSAPVREQARHCGSS